MVYKRPGKDLGPANSGWFLHFKDGINGSYSVPSCDPEGLPNRKCSPLYHDQEQTPQVPYKNGSCPSGHTLPNSDRGWGECDGKCEGWCDCGAVPCGEYLWDHRNGSMLQKFLVDEYIFGKNGMGNDAISGMYIDDIWSTIPSEENHNATMDAGLSAAEITKMHDWWANTSGIVSDRATKEKKYLLNQMPYLTKGIKNSTECETMMNHSAAPGAHSGGCGDYGKFHVLLQGITINLPPS